MNAIISLINLKCGRMLLTRSALFVMSLLVLPAAMAQQQNAIESITTNQAGSVLVVRVQMKTAPVAVPPAFAVSNPARIALDFPGVSNGTGQSAIEVNQGELRSLNIVQAGQRSRLVLNLKRSVPYTTAIEGNAVLITLDAPGAPVAVTTSSQPVRFAEPGTVRTELRDIDFRRGREGEGRVVIDLSSPATGVDIRQQGQSLVLDFINTTLPPNLRRRLDVTDFGTPIQSVNTFVQGNGVRMVIEPKGLWEHNAYQSDTQFVLEVKPLQEDPNKLTQGSRPGYKGEKLSLNFQNIEVRSVLQVIADFTNLNIITSESVGGSLTLRLRDVPWDQALDIVLQAKGLDMRKNGNVVWIAPRDELATKEKLELEAKQQINELEPLRTENFQVNYTKAADLFKIMSDEKNRFLTKRGSVVSDSRTNQLIVTDVASKLEEFRRVIRTLDIPQRQVLIEARIVEADDTFGRSLGVRLKGNSGFPREVGGSNVFGSVTGPNSTLGTGGAGAGTTGSGNQLTFTSSNFSIGGSDFVNLPAAGLSGFNAAGFAVTLFNSSLSRVVGLEITALEADGRGRIISSPRVVTADQVRATIEDGEEIPYEQATSSGATSISFRKAVLKLDVTPQITPEGNVILTVNVNKDSRGVETRAGPAINTKNVNTQVLIDNGGTVVIGGIYTQLERSDNVKVPLLGDIPYVGNLFKNNRRTNNRSELLVFLTPRIITDAVATSAVK